MSIKLLNDALINKIAAGEVVERPASIVKELVENAMDAGADKIAVNIVNGGIDRIEVEDNGCGIAPDDLALAFQRHATSKISAEADLNRILSMGFRGEALPSIAAVARIQVHTAQSGSNGMQVKVEGGTMSSITPFPCPHGTRITVSDVFYNTPARRQFLKTAVAEGNNVHDVMTKLAISRPDISIKFSNQNKIFFKTPGQGNLLDTIMAIHGQDFCQTMLAVDYQGERNSLSGLVSTPESTRTNRKSQLFFVNSRVIRSPMLYRAVDGAYRGMLISREFPIVFLFLTVPPNEIDVNVHPQKTEVRFRDEKTIFKLIQGVVREALKGREYNFQIPVSGERWDRNHPGYNSTTASDNLVVADELRNFTPRAQRPDAWPNTVLPLTANYNNTEVYNKTETDQTDYNQDYRVIGQCLNTYILVEKDRELLLIDQHAAHERINYDRIKNHAADTKELEQLLAFPVTLHMSVKQTQVLEDNAAFFTDLGFEFDYLGPTTIAIRSAPWPARGKEQEVFLELLEMAQDGNFPDLTDEAHKLMACKKSVKSGQVLTRPEMDKITSELFQLTDYKNCPHGRPTMLTITRSEMDRHFKRI